MQMLMVLDYTILFLNNKYSVRVLILIQMQNKRLVSWSMPKKNQAVEVPSHTAGIPFLSLSPSLSVCVCVCVSSGGWWRHVLC